MSRTRTRVPLFEDPTPVPRWYRVFIHLPCTRVGTSHNKQQLTRVCFGSDPQPSTTAPCLGQRRIAFEPRVTPGSVQRSGSTARTRLTTCVCAAFSGFDYDIRSLGSLVLGPDDPRCSCPFNSFRSFILLFLFVSFLLFLFFVLLFTLLQ